MNVLEKIVAFISPGTALKRMYAKQMLKYYEAGEMNRFTDSWRALNGDDENMAAPERDIIKARARYLERNSDIANSLISAFLRNVIGTGIKPQARTGSKDLDDKLEALWKKWATTNCDITGQSTFYELQKMLLLRRFVDGEILVNKVYDNNAEIPLKLQVIKTDLLDTSRFNGNGKNVVRSGVEVTSYLKPVAYWILQKTPDGFLTLDSKRVKAENMIHLFNKTSPEQIRGISELAPLIKRTKSIEDFLDAETMSAKIAACFSIFIKRNNGGYNQYAENDKNRIEEIHPGMISYLNQGESIETANPSRSMTSARDVVNLQQRLMGAGAGLSYELVSRDFNNANFSAARQGLLEDQMTFKPIQKYMIEHFCNPIWSDFVEACVLKGLINIKDFFSNKEKYTNSAWIAPGWSWIDPEKEVNADIKAMQNGGKTLSQWCAERGDDWQSQLDQMAREKEYAEKLGLKLNIHTPEAVQAAQSNHVQNIEGGGKTSGSKQE